MTFLMYFIKGRTRNLSSVRSKILEYMAIKNKVLYVYVRTPISVGQNMILLDKIWTGMGNSFVN